MVQDAVLGSVLPVALIYSLILSKWDELCTGPAVNRIMCSLFWKLFNYLVSENREKCLSQVQILF